MRKALLCLALLATACGNRPADLTVCAAASLNEAMEEIAKLYGSQARVAVSYGSSGMLAQQIERGVPADVFFSAAPKPMDDLQAKGLILPETRRDLLSNRIVLIVPQSGGASSFEALTLKGDLIAIGDPDSVPAGDYARQVLTSLQLWDKLRARFVFAQDVRQVLNYVETRNVEAGIVYATDAKTSSKVKVAAIASESTHKPVLYPVAVLKESTHPDRARAFAAFLASPPAREVFTRRGFTVTGP